MSPDTEESVRFSRWIARPQSLIALAAVALSLCGIFIALYEASLIRRAQRASVWPHVKVAASMNSERVQIWVQNVGVGPARVRAAGITWNGEVKKGWADLIRSADVEPDEVSSYYSLIRGTVLPRDSEAETIFRVSAQSGPSAAALIERLHREILLGTVDVTVCYCSVYDECWLSSMRDLTPRASELEAAGSERPVESCEQAPRSAI